MSRFYTSLSRRATWMSSNTRPLLMTALCSFLCWNVIPTTSNAYAQGDPVVFDFNGKLSADGIPDPWVVKVKVPRPDFRVVTYDQHDNESVLYFVCSNASFSLNRRVSVEVTRQSNRQLTWEWKAERLPTSVKADPQGSNDQALQVYLCFEQRRAIGYHWDTDRKVGTIVDESIPLIMSIKDLVVESGKDHVGKWTRVTRDVYEDFKRLYDGAEPGRIEAVRIQTNSQHTHSVGAGYVTKLTLQ